MVFFTKNVEVKLNPTRIELGWVLNFQIPEAESSSLEFGNPNLQLLVTLILLLHKTGFGQLLVCCCSSRRSGGFGDADRRRAQRQQQ